MAIKIIQLGSKHLSGEGLRIGAVMRPPWGAFKSEYLKQGRYYVRYPNISPDAELLKWAKSNQESNWYGTH